MDINQGLAIVETRLRELLSSDLEILQIAGNHLLQAGGKRIRPRVLLLSYWATGGTDFSRVSTPAALLELLHTASLVHDDINDHSQERRGVETVNAKWGNTLALLTGDFIIAKFIETLTEFDKAIIQSLARATLSLVEGETLQIISQQRSPWTEDLYTDIIRKKTAALFTAAAEIGGVVNGAAEAEIEALCDYGLNLGMAFQITDDLLDLIGDPRTLGKPIWQDLAAHQSNLAVIYVQKRLASDWEQTLTEQVCEKILCLLRDSGAIQYAQEQASGYAAKAQESLAILPESDAKQELLELTHQITNREF